MNNPAAVSFISQKNLKNKIEFYCYISLIFLKEQKENYL